MTWRAVPLAICSPWSGETVGSTSWRRLLGILAFQRDDGLGGMRGETVMAVTSSRRVLKREEASIDG